MRIPHVPVESFEKSERFADRPARRFTASKAITRTPREANPAYALGAMGAAEPVLPRLYARWIDELLTEPVPAEQRSTCGDCAMCQPRGAEVASLGEAFEPNVKCCSYLPELPNFTVGAVLTSGSAKGRETVLKRIRARAGVTPVGVGQPPKTRLVLASSKAAFGRSREIVCPHYVDDNGGQCSIWAHRDAVCSTYFCKHMRGAVGQTFWFALRGLLAYVERDVARFCVMKLDPGPEAIEILATQSPSDGPRDLDVAALEDREDPNDYARRWGSYVGREEEFYTACSEMVAELEWADVVELCGADVALRALHTRHVFRQLKSDELPPRLLASGYTIAKDGPNASLVVGYSLDDAIEVPKDVLGALHVFDGRPTAEAMDAAKTHGVTLSDAEVRRLADFKILEPT